MTFINRAKELHLLTEMYDSQAAELLIVYGRRRVGKTELLRHFSRNQPHIFFTATQTTDKNLLSQWSQLLWQHQAQADIPDFSFPDWESSLRYLASMTTDEKLVVVIDEFPYLIDANPALPSILQKMWDELLQQRQILLILCGSSIGMMEKYALNHSSPLYGRRSGQLLLPPLDFAAARQFFPDQSLVDQVEKYAVFGGIPAYLKRVNPAQSLAENVIRQILTPNRFLYDEPLFLLRTELREPRNYFAILQAIAHGNTRPNAIAQASGVGDARTVSKYLSVLQELHLVERAVPVTESQPRKSRRGIYQLADNFLQFWFRFVAPHRSDLEQGQAERVWDTAIQPRLSEFVGPIFEVVCRQRIWDMARAGALPFMPQKVGGWWSRQAEIDVLAINETAQAALAVECKWRNRPVGARILTDLQTRVNLLQQQVPFKQIYYALASKSGFTENLIELAQAPSSSLILLEFPPHIDP